MHIIAGVDPGKTCGIACIDLNGRLVFSNHALFGGHEWVISTLTSVGKPVIIASDRTKAGATVRKVNSAFSSRLMCPDREFKVSEKRDAARAVGIKDPHERDAYTAALFAYKAFANKFKQAERIASARNVDTEEIKAKIVAKYSIREAIENRKTNRR